MDISIARQPVFDRYRQVFGYELLFRPGPGGRSAGVDGDHATARVIVDSLLRFGIGRITGGKRAFINFTRDTLVRGYATLFPREQIVVEILEDVEQDPEVYDACRELKQAGYLLALDDFVCEDWANPLLRFADIIKVDFRATAPAARAELPRALAYRKLRSLAEKVETRAEFDEAIELGFTYLQGFFFSRPLVLAGRDIPGFRLRYLEVLREVNRPQVDFAELEAIIKREPSLLYKLLTYINAVAFGFRARITSVRQALMLLGEDAVKKWASIVALAGLTQDQPSETVVTSLVRARFCEQLAPHAGLEERAQELFFLGLFSLLDALTGRPMPEVVADLPLADDIKLALLGNRTRPFDVLSCVLAQERGDWAAVELYAAKLRVPEAEVARRYLEAVAWGTESFLAISATS